MRARVIAAALALGGCQAYTPLPLPTRAPLAASLASLDRAGVDLARPLGVADAAALAVANSPDLAATRAQRGVAGPQLLQAGLYANPSLTGSILPLVAGPAAANIGGSSTIAWNAGISYDIRSLITHRSRLREARMATRAVDAALLWQEWQTAAAARLLAVDIIEGDRVLSLLAHTRDLLASRGVVSRRALAQGNATLATAAPDIAAAQAAEIALYAQARTQLGKRHQLNALIGLAPGVPLSFAPSVDLPPFDAHAICADLSTLPERRPDLAALRFGYSAENAKLRTAILDQFPNLTFGITGGSDNSNVRSIGPQITLDLPIFDRNQGNIAIERATRHQLWAEYRSRLAASEGEVGAALAEITQLQGQLAHLRPSLGPLQRQAESAARARARGDLDERSALDLILTPVTREQDIAVSQLALDEQLVALATLTGTGLPALHPYLEESGR